MLAINNAAALIFFRELFEITLIIGMVMAATKTIAKRNFWVACGLIVSIGCSLIMAYFASIISNLGEGNAEDLINVIILSLAVVTIAWTVLWMKQQVIRTSNEIRQLGENLTKGSLPSYTIAIVVFTAVFREATEIILLLHGLIKSSHNQVDYLALASGLGIGGSSGVTLGLLFYFGLVSVPKKYIFSITSWLLILLAAGMAAQIPNYLQAIGILDEFSKPLWDSSALLAETSIIGQICHLLIGYTAKPSLPQLIFYIGTLLTICTLLYKRDKAY